VPIAVLATPGAYVDTNTRLAGLEARALKAAGKLGVFRYVPLPGESNRRYAKANDISSDELKSILDEGLLLGLVQHVRTGPGDLWRPSDHSSSEDAAAAAGWALQEGYPEGCHLYLDLEAVNDTRVATIAYCVGWQRALMSYGFKAGLYHGYSVPLGAVDLYDLPGFDTYWSDAGNRLVSVRGNSIVQGPQVVIAGVKFDEDTMVKDALGEVPYLCAA
jgi:hypothetical protein